eukprot:g1464.t1
MWEPGRRLFHKPFPKLTPVDVLDMHFSPDTTKPPHKRPTVWRKMRNETGHRLWYNMKTLEVTPKRPSTGQMGILADHFRFGKRPPSTERCGTCDRMRSLDRQLLVKATKIEVVKQETKKKDKKKSKARGARGMTQKSLKPGASVLT